MLKVKNKKKNFLHMIRNSKIYLKVLDEAYSFSLVKKLIIKHLGVNIIFIFCDNENLY